MVIYHAQHGNRGIETKLGLKQEILRLGQDLSSLKAERGEWERRVAMLRPAAIDRDLLDERARLELNRLHRNDVVIMTGEPPAN
jgi:cell division protein FtsB